MKFIEEIVVEEFLPTFRSMLAEALRERGHTQLEVAEALGISQSAVSKYVHGDIDQQEAVLNDDRVQEHVTRIADGLADGEMTQVQALIETEVLIRELERGDLLARLHEAAMPAIEGRVHEFSVHDPESDLRATEQVLASVRRGIRVLENTRGFASLIPNTGANLVECLPEAETIEDVAGIPGHIFDVKGRPSVPADPEFGASEHVASVLLAARRHGSDARAVVNIRYMPAIVETLEAMGLETATFDAEFEDVDVVIETALTETSEAEVLYQTGGFGIEPIVYILAPSAETAAERVRTLCDRLDADGD
ncbi:MAG: thiamine-phosphate synthase family protein [Halobacteriales archaeon]